MSLISELYIKAERCYPSLSGLEIINKSIHHHLFVTVMKGVTGTLDLELECQAFSLHHGFLLPSSIWLLNEAHIPTLFITDSKVENEIQIQ